MDKLTEALGRGKMRILFVSTEQAPFAKAGGLGEVVFSLPRALRRLGHDARVMIPLYGSIDRVKYEIAQVCKDLQVPTAPANEDGIRISCNVRAYHPKGGDRDPVTTYFLENREYYELRSNAYGYTDDNIRFALLSRGCLEFLDAHREWKPDIIVTTDWMTGYLPNFLKHDYKDNAYLQKIATLYTIHNLEGQGTSQPQRFIPESERDDGHGPIPALFGDRLKHVNAMRRAIMNADAVNTVSPTYAQEIMTEEYGEDLHNLLREQRAKLYGILNGIDYETNDPSNDRLLDERYSSRNLDGRIKNKIELQRRLGLRKDKDAFVVGVVSRITGQKGFHLLPPIMDAFFRFTGAQFIVVGTGDDTDIKDYFAELPKRYPEQAAALLQYDGELPHLMFAGCDILLIPSKFEPSGLTQMEAMHYGTVPVARKTGGLADTIDDFVPGDGNGTGFLFENMDPQDLLIAMIRAYVNWQHRAEWKHIQRRGMSRNFSWENSARKYAGLFRKIIAEKREKKALS
jgi:starch synthase